MFPTQIARFLGGLALLLFISCGREDGPVREDNAALGMPSAASSGKDDDFLIERTSYTLSYNRDRGTANWVAWHLNAAWKGDAVRTNTFVSDPVLPQDWFAAVSSDYTSSGFDRGHLCPSDDRDFSQDENAETFYMTNIIPQAPDCNQEPWADMENYCRQLVEEGNELYLYAGPAGKGGSGSNGSRSTLAGGDITVPAQVWKVALVLPEGDKDVKRINGNTRVIAVIMPNTQSADNNPWREYRVSVNEIEDLTGLDFFSNLSNSTERTLEKKVDEE